MALSSRLRSDAVGHQPVMRCLAGERMERPPLWLMRQAGRYLPEYRELRSRSRSFLDLCFDPRAATEVTLQPIRRFGFDAAILFSDILVVPHALGQQVSFETGEGPRLAPVVTGGDLAGIAEELDLRRLAPVFETLERLRQALPDDTTLLGFCGAPWTVASYMVAGQGTPDQRPARLLAYRDPATFGALIELLIGASVAYLVQQLDSGADAVQVFDSWAGVLPSAEFARWCAAPMARVVAGIKAQRPHARVIAFSRVASPLLAEVARTSGADAIGLDTAVDLRWAAEHVQPRCAVQGNLDPLQLLAGGEGMDRAVDAIRSALAAGPHIFNLGHGILPETPIEHVERLVRRLRNSDA